MGERLSHQGHYIGRTIGATLLGAGVLLSTPERHADAFVDYSLPAIDHSWPDSQGGEIFARIHFDQNSWGYFVDNNGLPKPYTIALNNALDNPVASAAIRDGQVRDLTVRKGTSETRDNGQFDFRQSELKIFLSSGDLPSKDRLYFDSRIFKAAVIHESVHADSEKWYQYLRGDLQGPYPPADIASDLEEIQNVQNAVNDIYFDLPDPCSPSLGEAQDDCSMIKLQMYADESFKCIDEGHALQDVLNRKKPLPIGHPANGTYEAAASIVTSLEMNPEYTPDCLDKNSSKLMPTLRELTKRILKLTFKTSPKIEEALRRTPDRSDAIDRLIS